MKYILALDQGTTSSRAILFDRAGHLIATGQNEFRQFYPSPGMVEHDPEEIWFSQNAAMEEAMTSASAKWSDIAAVGITNQRETTLLWDRRTGGAVSPAIVWQDRRTGAMCAKMREEGHEAEIMARTGLLLDPYFSATKLRWLLDSNPAWRADAEAGHLAFGTVDSWLVWKLTRGASHLTDETNASRTLLFNIHEMGWDNRLLELFEIPRAVLPEVMPGSGKLAVMQAGGCEIPICGIAGDQQAALFGQACTRPGMVKNTYGTGCFLLMHTGSVAPVSANRLLSTVACRSKGQVSYALEGSVFVGGAVVQWLRDGLGLIQKSEEIESLAASVSDNGGVTVVPAFTGLGAPYWDSDARGTITGLTRGTGAGHIARAVIESIAFQSAEVMEAMAADSGIRPEILRVDGGASRNDLLLQFQSDLLGIPVVRPKITETTALGAAYLAGLGCGFWGSEEEIDTHWESDREFEPSMSRDEAAGQMKIWRRAVQKTISRAGE